MGDYPIGLDPKDVLGVLIRARNAEPTGSDYQVYERAIDALTQHSVIRAQRRAALNEMVKRDSLTSG